MPLFWLYKNIMTAGKPLIKPILMHRMKMGKEDAGRIGERFGRAPLPRPEGTLLWVHVASVGEAQSMLRLITLFLDQNPKAFAVVSSITVTSATLLADRLPPRAVHVYCPVDRPSWVKRFLDHWQPDMIFWAESELWPCMIHEIGRRHIPMALINARMSPASYRNWRRSGSFIGDLLTSFSVILAQSALDRDRFISLGGRSVVVAGNIKFAAQPLPHDPAALETLRRDVAGRPVWVYASSHEGEEELALETHRALLARFPDLLTIIIPRHPARCSDLIPLFASSGFAYSLRSHSGNTLPAATQIYLVDTLGEMGLFYRLSPLAVVGRSFSCDGGGGHNPLEPALLSCAVLHGSLVQNLADIYTPMDEAGAAIKLSSPHDLVPTLAHYLSNTAALHALQRAGYDFALERAGVLDTVIEELEPLFLLAGLPVLTHDATPVAPS